MKEKKKEEKAEMGIAPASQVAMSEIGNVPMSHPALDGVDIDTTDLIIPRISLMQPSDKRVTKKEAESGHFVNNLTLKDYGIELIFIPLAFMIYRILWHPKDHAQGIECAAFNGKIGNTYGDCETCLYNYEAKLPNEDKRYCGKIYTFPSLLQNESFPVAIPFHSTAVKTAKKLLTFMKLATTGMVWYKIITALTENEKGAWWKQDVVYSNKLSDNELNFYNAIKGSFKKDKVAKSFAEDAEPDENQETKIF